jgi:DNA repair photolyase
MPMREILEACVKYRVAPMVSFSITGLGGTSLEKGVLKYKDLLSLIGELIEDGTLNAATTTIRVDPILPGVTDMNVIKEIIQIGKSLGIKKYVTSLVQSYDTYADRDVVEGIDNALATEGKTYNWEQYYGRITEEDVKASKAFIQQYKTKHPEVNSKDPIAQ